MRHRTCLGLTVTVLLLSACASDSARSSGSPFEAFETRLLLEDVELTPFTFDRTRPNEGVGMSASEVLQPAQLHRVALDTGETECLTCDHGDSIYNANFHPMYTPDGEHIVYASARDRAMGDNMGLLTLGGELYLMDRTGEHPTRLTDLGGFARAPRISNDGTKVFWTQVTSDNRWHLVFADLERDGESFSLGPISEVTVGGSTEAEELAHALSWKEWKFESFHSDFWTVGATYAGRMNVDTYAVSVSQGVAHRLTQSPENEEFASWDPAGGGLVLNSGRNHYQARQLNPIPQPAFSDYAMVIFGLVFVQTGRAVPWGTDLFYMDSAGENGLLELHAGAADGYLASPTEWRPDGSGVYFETTRVGLANPDPTMATRQLGVVEFERPRNAARITDEDFLASASLGTLPVTVAPFDPEDVTPSLDVTVEGPDGGTAHVVIDAALDHEQMSGTFHITYDDYVHDGYELSGESELAYEVPLNLLTLSFSLASNVSATDPRGLSFALEEAWTFENLTLEAQLTYASPGNVETRTLSLDSSVLFGGL